TLLLLPPPRPPLPTRSFFPYTTLFRSVPLRMLAFTPKGATMYPTEDGFGSSEDLMIEWREQALALLDRGLDRAHTRYPDLKIERSEEHTSELQSRFDIVCRLLLENTNT